MSLSVVIPTYRREAVLVDSVRALLPQMREAHELLVLDQSESHEPETEEALAAWDAEGQIRWIRLPEPGITPSMNRGFQEASQELVLFLDDDIIPGEGLLQAHLDRMQDASISAVSGQVLQPGQEPEEREDSYPLRGLHACMEFPFNSTRPAELANVMAGNLCVRRAAALAAGGFDEQFMNPAYRFETEFCRRIMRQGRVVFEPAASIRHLRAERGGTRARGSHLTSPSPRHGFGDYYFALRHGQGTEKWRYILKRPFREVCTKFHLRHPWFIPVKFIGELRALGLALRRVRRGPKLLQP